MKLRAIVLLFALAAMQGNAQTFLGKRAVISGTVLNGSRNFVSDIRGEFVLNSKLSLFAGFEFMKFKAVPTYSVESVSGLLETKQSDALQAFLPSNQVGLVLSGYYFDESYSTGLQDDFNAAKRLTIQPRVFSFGLKKYRNDPFNAPFGAYTYYSVQYGTYSISGPLAVPILYEDYFGSGNFQSAQSRYINGVSTQIRQIGAEFGWGRTWFLSEWLNLDLGFGINGSYVSDQSIGALEKYMAVAYWRQAPGNVYLLKRLTHRNAERHPADDMTKDGLIRLGMSFQLRLGIAL